MSRLVFFSEVSRLSGKVTALKAQARDKGRVNVYLDGQFAIGLAAIVAARLKVGQTLSDEDLRRLEAADAGEQAYERALRLLSYRARSEAEVRRGLRRHKTPDEVVEQVVERLKRAGLLDDAAFARLWIEDRATFRPRGRRALRSELRAKGLSPAAIDAALSEVDDAQAAYAAARKRAARLTDLAEADFRRRLGDFLARRGFDYDIIGEVVEKTWREVSETKAESED